MKTENKTEMFPKIEIQ